MITVHWSSETTNVVIWTFTAPWTFEEFYKAKNHVDMMIDTVEGYVDSIFIPSKGQPIPHGSLTHLRNLIINRHERHRYLVIVGPRVFLVTLLNILTELIVGLDLHLRTAKTESQAYQIIEQQRTKQVS